MECTDGTRRYFSEWRNWWKTKNHKKCYPPATDDNDVWEETWHVADKLPSLYLEHVQDLRNEMANYHEWSRIVKTAIDWVHDLPKGKKNELVRLGEDAMLRLDSDSDSDS